MINNFTKNGVIGKNGKFYGCGLQQHIPTTMKHVFNAPFVIIRNHLGGVDAEFEAYYTVDHTIPTKKQFETLMDWCIYFNEKFEDIVDCWREPWEDWLE